MSAPVAIIIGLALLAAAFTLGALRARILDWDRSK